MKTAIALLAASMILTGSAATRATDGIAVSAHYHYPLSEATRFTTNTFARGMIVRTDIRNNAVAGRDTLFDGIGEYPAINYEGTKVAFFRWGVRVAADINGRYQTVSGTQTLPCSLSVVNIDGTGLRGLVQVALRTDGTGQNAAILDWPYGDYIYYEKPWRTCEIWRANVNSPSDTQLVVKYATDGDISFPRWNLSLDARWSAVQIVGDASPSGNIGHSFPPPNGNVANCQFSAMLPGCNLAISASGDYLASYLAAGHSQCLIRQWNKRAGHMSVDSLPLVSSIGIEDWEQRLGRPIGLGAELIRWSVNSDKWLCRQIAWCGGTGLDLAKGSNQLLVNWVDSVGILASNNQAPADCEAYTFEDTYVPALSNCAGDFWVAGVPAGQYESVDGTFEPVSVRQAYRPGSNPGASRSVLDRTGAHGPDRAFDLRGRRISAGTWMGAPLGARPGVYVVSRGDRIERRVVGR